MTVSNGGVNFKVTLAVNLKVTLAVNLKVTLVVNLTGTKLELYEMVGVYLTAYLNTSSENMNSFPYFRFGTQFPLHLITSS